MRRFLINRKAVTMNGSEIVNLGFGCEMWDQGPVAVIETLPPYQARWFLNLDAVRRARFYLPCTGQLAAGQRMQIDLLMVDEQEVNYWTMLASKFGVSTEAITPLIETGLPLPASIPNAGIPEQIDPRLFLHQAALIAPREATLSGKGAAN